MRRIQRSLLMLMRVSLGRPTKAGHCRGTAAGRDYASDALFGPRITTPRRFWHAGTRGKPVGGVAPAYNNEAEIGAAARGRLSSRSEEHTSELQSLMRISYAVFCLKKQKT